MDNLKFIFWGLLVALGLAIFVSPFACPWPDGLEKVAETLGFLQKGEISYFKAPIPDYVFPGIENELLATSISGLIGTIIMFGVGYGVAVILRRS